jgi:hypothetical protein
MTVTDYLNWHKRRILLISNSAWGVALPAGLFSLYLQAHRGSSYGLWALMLTLLMMIIGFSAVIVAKATLQCPFCAASLLPGRLEPADRAYIKCPRCEADFNRPMPDPSARQKGLAFSERESMRADWNIQSMAKGFRSTTLRERALIGLFLVVLIGTLAIVSLR